ncbi:response regulator [Jannaschia sp. 2305UL9-9]|uniref:response regulator n=1 Tax=Jannaschia sp. 2305UL9-9 TaxID=3121638 RepID=UPI003528E18B
MNLKTTRAILVLEDEAIIAMDIALTLEDAGFGQIVVCGTSDDAHACIDAGAPRLAIVDLNLQKGQTSLSVTARLADLGIPFIVLSGESEVERHASGMPSVVPRIAKPFKGADLIAMVGRILDGA